MPFSKPQKPSIKPKIPPNGAVIEDNGPPKTPPRIAPIAKPILPPVIDLFIFNLIPQ